MLRSVVEKSDGFEAGRVPLLPHEKWFVQLVLRRQRKEPTKTFERMEENYGPDGTTRLLAAYASGAPASVVGVISIFIVIASAGRGPWLLAAHILMVLVGCALVVALVRAWQASLSGRTFRGDKPFQR
jgi:hypothetical protein